MGPGSDHRRMWVLSPPPNRPPQGSDNRLRSKPSYDLLLEIDTVTGAILQRLVIEGCKDGHDVVRVGNDRAFVVDTRHGHIIEISIPASSHPYTETSIRAGASSVVAVQKGERYVDIIKRHTGFIRGDHVNNVAIHPQLLISNLHGKEGLAWRNDNLRAVGPSPSRLSALDRSIPTEHGRELTAELDGFGPVQNVGTWCHGIAFWEDTSVSPSQIKLISLDSKSGTAVSVILSGPNAGFREVLWTPDEDHPVLVPPKGVANAYNNGAKIFSKGLAVQGGVAYFGVSYARTPPLRQTVPESLLVAVDLAEKKELWTRTVRSNGLIQQILTKSSIGDVQLPRDVSSVELTYHGAAGGQMVEICDDIISEQAGTGSDVDYEKICALAYDDTKAMCPQAQANSFCCACRGGQRSKAPLVSGVLDKEIMNIEEEVNATVTFIQHSRCLNTEGRTKHLPLEYMNNGVNGRLRSIESINSDLKFIVKHLCHLNVEALTKRMLDLGDEGFSKEFQLKNGNSFRGVQENIKRSVSSINLVFSSKSTDVVYHFPWLSDWLPMLEELILRPLQIPINQIIRMQFANMPEGSDIAFHQDKNTWVVTGHRVHVPIITHPDIFFLTKVKSPLKDHSELLRIKSNAGEAYEFNNAMTHGVHNLGSRRVHLIIDWVESPIDDKELIKVNPGEVCIMKGQILLCSPPDEAKNAKEEL